MSDDLIARLRDAGNNRVVVGYSKRALCKHSADAIESLDSALEAAQQLAMSRGDELISKDAEIERLTAELEFHREQQREMHDNLVRLTAERDALRADAERARIAFFEFYRDWEKGDFSLPHLAQLDMMAVVETYAAIDAARQK